MLLSGLLAVLSLACGGYLVEKYVETAAADCCDTTPSYFDDEVIELGIQRKNPRKVVVEVYYETLCPDTRHFIRTQLYPTWQDLSHIMDIQWKPYGKAQHWEDESAGYSFECQFGPLECIGNMVHACSIKYISNDRQLADFIHCMIEDNYQPKEIGRTCAERHEVDWRPIHSCVNSKEGAQLLALHGDDTRSLRPKMSFVPHIVMNGRHIKPEDFLSSFRHILCSAYRGEKPEECIDVI